ncbi:MAG: endonuclease MutS2 [Chloroflexi bacterium]|nr:endonuclease MutS2 [Chloroflexota bacterium]
MQDKSLQTLEFTAVRERLAAFAATSLGREQALELLPTADAAAAVRRQQETREARRLLQEKAAPPLTSVRDVRAAVQRARKEGTLDSFQLLEVATTAGVTRQARASLLRRKETAPLLADLGSHLPELWALEKEITRCIQVDGHLADDASPLLRELRAETRLAHEHLVEAMNRFVQSPQYREVLQEGLVTQRNNRYVLPVKADHRSALSGIVHDVSSTGATLFIEPLGVVDLGNHWRELQEEEAREEHHVLRRLTGLVAEEAPRLGEALAVLAHLDLALAKGRHAEAVGGVEPELVPLSESASLRLEEARHPLIPREPVPITIEVGGPATVLLITGPNTGGKTVALKTVGLLSLMALAGLQVPARAARVPLYRRVFADIGDEQSIEQSLSTFSSHMATIVQVLQEGDDGCLVLLDELGAGTDPDEGSALAQAILSYLLERRITTVATTHHSDLKSFAQTTPGARNASVEFDAETLAPTYRLVLGLPGRSNALAIAQRLGVPSSVLKRARQTLGQERVKIDSLLAEIQQERAQTAELRRVAEKAQTESATLRAALERELQEAERERRGAKEQGRRDLLEETKRLQARLARLRAMLDYQLVTRETARENTDETEEVRQALSTASRRAALERRPTAVPKPGTPVYIPSLGVQGMLLTAPDEQGEVDVQMGAVRGRLPWHQLEPLPEERRGGPVQRSVSRADVSVPVPAKPPSEILLRRKTTEEAIEELEARLNQAFLSGLATLRVVHGKGTGTLRRAVHRHLGSHPLVDSFQIAEAAEGGEGATIVHISLQKGTASLSAKTPSPKLTRKG